MKTESNEETLIEPTSVTCNHFHNIQKTRYEWIHQKAQEASPTSDSNFALFKSKTSLLIESFVPFYINNTQEIEL